MAWDFPHHNVSDLANGSSEFTKKRDGFPLKVVSCPDCVFSQFETEVPQMKRLPEETVVGRNPRPASQEDEDEGRAFQASFFKRMGSPRQLLDLLEFLPDVEYFAKDVQGRFVAISRGMLRRIGASAEEEYLGIADSVIHPPSVARSIREDDLHVMRTGKPIVDRVEALFARTRAKDWFLTTKLPVYDAAGEVIGVMGFVRPYRPGASSGVQDVQVQRVVSHIHEHYRERIPVSEYARIAHLSERQLNRRFQETFRMSLQEFIMRTRIQAASDDLLVTDKPVAEIAHEHGFYDQSSFTKHFRSHTGETPLAFRQYRRLSRALKPGRVAVVAGASTGGPDT